jgi:EpsI family protein
MLVADACSGLNSIYSLFALSLLYAHLVGPKTPARLAAMLSAVVPIAVAANVVRVTALALITVHFGDDAAAGFLHGFAGLVVFLCALLLLIQFDATARRYLAPEAAPMEWKLRTATRWMPAFAGSNVGTVIAAGFAVAFLMVGTAVAVPMLKPHAIATIAPDLDAMVPKRFGDWRLDPDVAQVPPMPDAQGGLDRVYDQIVERTYVDSRGRRMMLLIAYGGEQSDALKAHRQEGCYASQGFEIRDLHAAHLTAGGRTIPVTRMHATRGARSEPVTYWFTMGDRVVMSRFERLRMQLQEGWAGRIPDGLLVRVSNLSREAGRSYTAHDEFLSAAMAAIPAAQRWRFVGRGEDD